MFKKIVIAVVAVGVAGALVGCQQKRTKKAAKVKGLESIYFDFDKSNVKPEWKQTLDNNSQWLKSNKDAKIQIQGNCDERGTVEYNIALGQRRADSAKNYLVGLGLPAAQLSTVSFGKNKPVCTESNESCWWKNRRDDFVSP